ncbi:MAG TPA: hypothetical protein DFS52_23450, partial [Myxococcales bacterium]|nr:hypothetical protein [Myxococcales bacterium]
MAADLSAGYKRFARVARRKYLLRVMRLRFKLVLLTAVSTLPFLVAMPWALREVQGAFDRELDGRLDGAERSARAAIGELESQVERAVRDLAMDPAVEDIARAVH